MGQKNFKGWENNAKAKQSAVMERLCSISDSIASRNSGQTCGACAVPAKMSPQNLLKTTNEGILDFKHKR